MAQTFARFGSEVFLFEREGQILPREDADAAAIVARQFERDGVSLMLQSQEDATRAGREGDDPSPRDAKW